jgi:hypothetical protein
MLDHLITTFNITHNYFSSPLRCSTLLRQFYSPFQRDCIFGSLGTAFSHKWKGQGFAHPPTLHSYLSPFTWPALQLKQIPYHILYLSIQIPTGTNTWTPTIWNTQILMSLHIYLQIHCNIMNPSNLHTMTTPILNPKPYKFYVYITRPQQLVILHLYNNYLLIP